MVFEIKTYRKKPVEIEAMEFTGTNGADVVEWMGNKVTDCGDNFGTEIYIRTMEGTMHASPGDFVIRGVAGEFYPCKPDIFWKTYEEVIEDE